MEGEGRKKNDKLKKTRTTTTRTTIFTVKCVVSKGVTETGDGWGGVGIWE